MDSFVKEAEAKLRDAVELPEGYRLDRGGAFEKQQRALAKLSIIVPITIALIFVLPVVSDDEPGKLSARFNRMLDALAERERMRRTFSRFVPEEVAARLIADAGAIAPQERQASVLYADIEGFTALVAASPPREVLRMLNAHFERLAQCIHATGGVITQFQGDAVLACFGLPAPLPDAALRAVQPALAIACTGAAPAPAANLRVRVGVATGVVVGGTVGGGDGERVPLRDLGPADIRGIPQSVRIFEPRAASMPFVMCERG